MNHHHIPAGMVTRKCACVYHACIKLYRRQLYQPVQQLLTSNSGHSYSHMQDMCTEYTKYMYTKPQGMLCRQYSLPFIHGSCKFKISTGISISHLSSQFFQAVPTHHLNGATGLVVLSNEKKQAKKLMFQTQTYPNIIILYTYYGTKINIAENSCGVQSSQKANTNLLLRMHISWLKNHTNWTP